VRLETPLLSLTFPNRFPNQGKLYDLKFPAIALSSSSPFLSVPLSTIPCSSVGFSLPTELSYSTLRCGVASIGYLSDPFFFTLPAFDWNGTALFNSGLPRFRTLHPDRLPHRQKRPILLLGGCLQIECEGLFECRRCLTGAGDCEWQTPLVLPFVSSPSLPPQAVDVLNLNQPTNMTFAYQRDDWKSGNAIRVCGSLSLYRPALQLIARADQLSLVSKARFL
jgi:hypothetical protein